MAKLIAQVPTKVIVDGVAQIIQPGGELPELNTHDSAALVASSSALDEKAQAQKARADAKAKADARAEFEASRTAVKAAQASTKTTEGKADKNA